MRKKRKHIWATMLLLVMSFPPLLAQSSADSAYVFRFVADKDMFYVPWHGNGAVLDSLVWVVVEHRQAIDNKQMYLSACSYGSGNYSQNSSLGYLRCHRVKSELILRTGIREENFLTDRYTPTPFKGEKNVVVITFPAPLAKIAEKAGPDAAERVKQYNADLQKHDSERVLQTENSEELQPVELVDISGSGEMAQQAVNAISQRETDSIRSEEQPDCSGRTPPYSLSLRANLLRWATLTPDFGIEWRINRNIGLLVSGSWTSWSWKDKDRRYALWRISPEFRYYIGKERNGYIGAMYHIGEFNYKLAKTGKQGDLQGGGLVGGYQLKMSSCLNLDFTIGLGCTHADYDKYEVIDGVRVKRGTANKNYWGVNQLGITLVWKIVRP